jgi:hypothetical protein
MPSNPTGEKMMQPDPDFGRLAASGDRATDASHGAAKASPPSGSVSAGAGVERGAISLAGPRGNKPVADAALLPSLAVHRSIIGGRDWTITHRATGCAMGFSDDEAAAIRAAQSIEREHADALAELNKLGFGEQSPKRTKAIKRLISTLQAKGLRP